jgi:hypothetical protein
MRGRHFALNHPYSRRFEFRRSNHRPLTAPPALYEGFEYGVVSVRRPAAIEATGGLDPAEMGNRAHGSLADGKRR